MRYSSQSGCRVDVIHHVTCRHQVEVEVSPPRAELYFGDERWIDPINTQIRFEATVFNSGLGVHWQVYDVAGGTGAGAIDATGRYQAPAKGSLTNGHTDVVVATSVEDPLRKAYAWVTLVGEGPLPVPLPRIEIWPKRVNLYYQSGMDNDYIDDSNKMQLFRATIWNSSQAVNWQVFAGAGSIDATTGLYLAHDPAPSPGTDMQQVIVRANLTGTPGVYDEAQVVLLNYDWPSLP